MTKRINSKPIMVDGVAYPSVIDAGLALGMTSKALCERNRRLGSYDTPVKKPPKARPEKPATRISVDGVGYTSLAEAARQLGVTRSTLYSRKRKHGSYDTPPQGRPAHKERVERTTPKRAYRKRQTGIRHPHPAVPSVQAEQPAHAGPKVSKMPAWAQALLRRTEEDAA